MNKFIVNVIIKFIVVLICGTIAFLCVYHDYSLYSKPIGKITTVKTSGEKQQIQAEIKNGEEKGQFRDIELKYDKALVYDQKYHKGDVVFLDSELKTITGVKRDHWVAAAVILLLGMLLGFGGRKGFFTTVCFVADIVIFIAMTLLYVKGVDILLMTVVSCLLFAFILLFLVSGASRVTWISFFVTIGALAVVGLLCFALIWKTDNMGYEYLDFLPEPYTVKQANHLFLSQIMIGCLGAIIDIAVTITACSVELIRKTPDIGTKALVDSAKEVADDITGTMINVVFFTNLAAIIPIFIISMRNDIGFVTVLKYDAFFEITRFLAGAIGILITIPLSVMASSMFLRRREKNDDFSFVHRFGSPLSSGWRGSHCENAYDLILERDRFSCCDLGDFFRTSADDSFHCGDTDRNLYYYILSK